MPKIPKIKPRRKYCDELPAYMESDKDFLENNRFAAVMLLNRELRRQKKLEKKKKG
jgi:hypothetical protein